MSLATRCPSCDTVFRVVQDQLKVSEGWVRCGRCDTVFSALEGLFDLEREAPPVFLAPSAPQEQPAPTDAPNPSPDESAALAEGTAGLAENTAGLADGTTAQAEGARIEPHIPQPLAPGETPTVAMLVTQPARVDEPRVDDTRIDEHLFGKPHAEADKGPAGHVDVRDRIDFSDARFDSDLFAEQTSLPGDAAASGTTGRTAEVPLESATRQTPGFVRRADRRDRWQRTTSHRTLVAACFLGCAALALQVVHHDRDTLASQWPATEPLLSGWCGMVGCSLSAPRRIEDVSVESTALTRAVGRDAFVFSAVLRNRSAAALAMPSIELTLTNADGRLVARRALAPADFGAADRMSAGIETVLDVWLGTGNLRVAGYTAEVFYP